ncbi:MAG: (d)CMP kinase [Candidatus Latescibacterota bacterium]
MTVRRPIVAIDGPVGAGKSTTAREVAKRLGFLFVDTGAMYRAVTLDVLNHGANPADEDEVKRIVAHSGVELQITPEGQRTLLNGRDVSGRIRDRDVTAAVSAVSAQKAVRDRMTELQRGLGGNGGVVMEGRDIGTVVFPDAQFKFYLDASIEARAARRYRELIDKGMNVSFEELAEEIRERDRANTERALAPLRRASDAVYIDTTAMTFEEQVSTIVSVVRGKKE